MWPTSVEQGLWIAIEKLARAEPERFVRAREQPLPLLLGQEFRGQAALLQGFQQQPGAGVRFQQPVQSQLAIAGGEAAVADRRSARR